MSLRAPLNSLSLQQRFPSVYSNFFAGSAIVCASSRSFHWANAEAVRNDGITIKQHFPSKIYVGIEPSASKKVKIDSVEFYEPSKSKFIKGTLNEHLREGIENYFIPFVNHYVNAGFRPGLKVRILAELPVEKRSYGRSGCIIASLMTAFLLMQNLIKEKDILLWKKTSTKHLIKDTGSIFDLIFRLSLKFEIKVYNGCSGNSIFSSLLPSKTPLIYFSNMSKISGQSIPMTEADQERHLAQVDRYPYWGFRLNELFPMALDEWPIDFVIFYHGFYQEIVDIIFALKNRGERLKKNLGFINNTFQEYVKDVPAEYVPFLNIINHEATRREPRRLYNSGVGISSFEILEAIKMIFCEGYSDDNITHFLRLINEQHYLYGLFEPMPLKIEDLYIFIKKYISRQIDSPLPSVGLAYLGYQKGIIFIAPRNSIRELLPSLIQAVRKRLEIDLIPDYISWLDGQTEGGLQVEQNIFQQKFWSSFPKNSILVHIYKKRLDQKEIKIVALSDIPREMKHCDLFCDPEAEELYFRGRPVTSREIHSQVVTTQILKRLLEDPDNLLVASELPDSSYVDRNEFQSKIVSPLTKLIRKETKKKFPLVLRGGIGRNFTIALESNPLTIGLLVKKLS